MQPQQSRFSILPALSIFPDKGKNQGIEFKSELLIRHLLELKNLEITRPLAELITGEVAKEIDGRRIEYLTSDLIHEIVAAKLEDLGLLDKQRAAKASTLSDIHSLSGNDFLTPEILNVLATQPVAIHTSLPEIIPVLKPKNTVELTIGGIDALMELSENTPEEIFERVAETVACVDKKYNPTDNIKDIETEFYNLMANREFLPEVSLLKNVGKSSSFFSSHLNLPAPLSFESVFETMKQATTKHSEGLSILFSLNRLWSKENKSFSPVSFLRLFQTSLQTLPSENTAGTKSCCLLDCEHPDILHFICSYDDDLKRSGLELLVGLKSSFFRAIQENLSYPLISPQSGEAVTTLRARQLFKQLTYQIWQKGGPAVYFPDRIETALSVPEEQKNSAICGTGDQILIPNEALVGGAVNLALMIHDGYMNWEQLKNVVHKAVHFLDNALSLTSLAEEGTSKNRKLALGVMGWASLLKQMGISYTSEDALQLANRVMAFIQKEASLASTELAKKRGVFPNWDQSIFKEQGIKRRHAMITSLLPTKTLHRIADCSEGIEPLENGIPPEWHLKMQAAFQRHTEQGVHKMIPQSPDDQEEEIARIILLGFGLGVKGIFFKEN